MYIRGSHSIVEHWVYAPKQCRSCSKFDHKTAECAKTPECMKCTSTIHTTDNCTTPLNQYKCSNCSKCHPSYSKECKMLFNQTVQTNKYYNSLLKHQNPEQTENKIQIKNKLEQYKSKQSTAEPGELLTRIENLEKAHSVKLAYDKQNQANIDNKFKEIDTKLINYHKEARDSNNLLNSKLDQLLERIPLNTTATNNNLPISQPNQLNQPLITQQDFYSQLLIAQALNQQFQLTNSLTNINNS